MRVSESIIWRTGQGTKAVIAHLGLLSGGAAEYLGGLAYKSFPGLDRCGDCAAWWRTLWARGHVLCMQINPLPWLRDLLDLGLDV